MLDLIAKFRNSLSEAQMASLQNKAGSITWGYFQRLLNSDTDDRADKNFQELRKELRGLPILKLMPIYSELSTEQKEILKDLL